MKTKVFSLIVIAAATYVAQATLTITGLAVGTAYPSAPASARLGLLIIGSGAGSTFLGGLTGNGLTSASVGAPTFNSSALGLTVGSTFGGNTVIGLLSSSGTFMNGANSSIAAENAGKQFAIIWTDISNASVPATLAPGASYGIAKASTWTLGADGTTLGFGTTATAANPFSRVTINQTGNSASSFGTVDIASQGLAFTVIPEPSAALLGAVGALVLLRRRRH